MNKDLIISVWRSGYEAALKGGQSFYTANETANRYVEDFKKLLIKLEEESKGHA